MNRYTHAFVVECPVNGVKVGYCLTIDHCDKILVEDLMSACDVGVGFHEDLADALHAKFGGFQQMRAYHHGTWIETFRGLGV